MQCWQSPQAIEVFERSIEKVGEHQLRSVETEVLHRCEHGKKIVSSDIFHTNLGMIAGILMAVGVSSANLAVIFKPSKSEVWLGSEPLLH